MKKIVKLISVFLALVCWTKARPSSIVRRGVENVNSTDFLIRFGFLQTNLNVQLDEGVGSPVNIEESKDSKIKRALLNFQKYYGLEQTGVLDEATIDLMGRPRCGDPDIYDNYRPSKFVLVNGEIWTKQGLTYDVLKYSNHMTKSEIDNELDRAFKTWSDVSNLKFRKINSADLGTEADIRVTFQRGVHDDGYDNAFDGKGGTLAHAYFPRDGRLHFDEDELWTTNQGMIQYLMLYPVSSL